MRSGVRKPTRRWLASVICIACVVCGLGSFTGCATPVAPAAAPAAGVGPSALRRGASTYVVQCDGRPQDLEQVLAPLVARLEAQRIPYGQAPSNEWRDCSGNFLRLSSYLASACPEQRANLAAPPGVRDYRRGGDNRAPGRAKARSSLELARWYRDRGLFTPIFYDGVTEIRQAPDDLRRLRNLIRPGAVLWFSNGRPTSVRGLDPLFDASASKTRINHMGTVTSVERDANGDVVRFAMYHGTWGRKPARVTRDQYWEWPAGYLAGGTKQYPPLGYWNQYLVGIGPIVPVGPRRAR